MNSEISRELSWIVRLDFHVLLVVVRFDDVWVKILELAKLHALFFFFFLILFFKSGKKVIFQKPVPALHLATFLPQRALHSCGAMTCINIHSPHSTLYSPFTILHSPPSTFLSPLSTLHPPLSILHSPPLHYPPSILYSPLAEIRLWIWYLQSLLFDSEARVLINVNIFSFYNFLSQ